ncbi:hypothetical protein MT325_m257R [Paramecium bursaria chlorella virus MT325]|uniref:Uncharacterized protein m257R n=1 Tax=Paramecium bursaria Chlorella virus MT325 TaxID=346932 RepID=A7ITY7_PBCVM|nr:hypothetical protein MT325_m257R [Paramecium bursaria chlorella virus MT325]
MLSTVFICFCRASVTTASPTMLFAYCSLALDFALFLRKSITIVTAVPTAARTVVTIVIRIQVFITTSLLITIYFIKKSK